MQSHILLVELNRHYYCFDDSKVKEKKLRFSRGLTEYIPSICQLDNKIFSILNQTRFRMQTLISIFENQIMSENLVLKISRRSVSRRDSQCRILIISVDLTKPLWRLLFIFSTIKIQPRELKKVYFCSNFQLSLFFRCRKIRFDCLKNQFHGRFFYRAKMELLNIRLMLVHYIPRDA